MAAVSIIMPAKNAEAFLAEAIASVRRQSFTDWELLIVDDGSTDTTPSIAAASAAADARIRLVDMTPGRSGAGAARNAGLGAATGELVAFLDADDLFESEKLAFETALLARYPTAAMTYGPAYWWFEESPQQSWTESLRPFAGRLHAPPDLLRKVILDQRSQVPCTCAVLIRRSAVEEAGGFFEGFRLYEDQTLWVKLMLRHPIFVHDRVLCRYRQHPSSVSAEAEAASEYDRMGPHSARTAFLEWIDEHARELEADPRLLRSLRLAFAPYANHRRPLSASDRLVLHGRALVSGAAHVQRRLWRRLTGLAVRR